MEIIKYGCCGNPYAHSGHWYVVGSNWRALAGAADYYCIGNQAIANQKALEEVREWKTQ